MQYPKACRKITVYSLTLLLLSAVVAPAAMAGRYVLNQTPPTIQRYFGRPLDRLTQTDNNGNVITTYSYSPAPIRRLLPKFPRTGKFKVIFANDRSTTIVLEVNASSEREAFSYRQAEAAKLYNYIFGYRPSIWRSMPLRGGPRGHEGFSESEVCLGDGILTSYMSYMLGDDNIRLEYDPRCEPPYR